MISIPDEDDYQRLLDRIANLEKLCKIMQNNAAAEWMSQKAVKQLLEVSTETLQNWRIKGILPGTKVGAKWYYKKVDVNKLFEPEGEKKRRRY